MEKENSVTLSLSLQMQLIDRIRKQLPEGANLAVEMSEVLNVSVTNCYRRIRGEVLLNLHELLRLTRSFHISLDELFILTSSTAMVSERPPFIYNQDDLLAYVKRTYGRLNTLSNLPHNLYYAARDLPIFVYFLSPSLARFKLFVWMNGINPLFKRENGIDHIRPELVENALELGDLYQRLNTLELWTDRTLNNQIRQIEYYFFTGFLSKEFTLRMLEELQEILDRLLLWTELGSKEGRGDLYLYETDFLMMANNALLRTEQFRISFISYAGINYVESKDHILGEDLERWFKAQVQHAQPLSKVNEKERLKFFQRMTKYVTALISEVEKSEGA